MNGTSDKTMDFGVDVETLCLERLQREALNCLEAFPIKVVELNSVIDSYMPVSIRTGSSTYTARRVPRSRSISSTIGECDIRSTPDLDVASYYSFSTYDRSRRTRHGICKRRYYRLRGLDGPTLRRRPGPLSQILAFIAGSLAICTKALIIKPSWYIVDGIISVLFQRRQLKNAQCGTSTNWRSSMSAYAMAFGDDDTMVGNLIGFMRPAAVQLIADTTMLKRWLQALALTSSSSPSAELISATRSTETIDGWGYELFFHLKYLQANRTTNADKAVTTIDPKLNDEVTHTNLWHRLVQLRDHYIILYETLYDDQKFHELVPLKLK